ncbi:CubicO group peptidase, beta-lactamase class C family [Anaerosphaera aminiphila DSM 21120]|uniref:CubicO group peptidase, beta-lactamase class C family n=1 Tax=Anaerosphaera aminiphila DSM 21120 TaxID=1120995 RepID=A0A1M5PIE3_9FIRM|nr:serine hydrolase domain-containing protein [Anaerosphaera aminiphila]SHH01527.1 CubicO group peptidase, beta-lactamase class C family [Anaerosphaera aminiphila DSM 21120]
MKKKILTIALALFLMLSSFPLEILASEDNVLLNSEELQSTKTELDVEKIEMITDEIAEKYINKDIVGASVAIIQDGNIVFEKGYGLASVEENIEVSPTETFMEAGSVSKLFTWTAVMQLVEEGKIDLDEDIKNCLPKDYLNLSFEKPITMNHLMTHSAGFEENPTAMMVSDVKDILPLEEYLSQKYAPKQIYSPGEVVAYSNYGTNLAGLIVERVSGVEYSKYIRENIFNPLDMTNAYFDRNYTAVENIMKNKSEGYALKNGEFKKVPHVYINDMPAGSLNITADNLAKFMLAHMNSDGTGDLKLFKNPETLSEMHTTLFSHEDMRVNAHGFWEGEYGGVRTLEHGGNTIGFTSRFIMVPETDFGICLLTNAASDMSGMSTELIETFIGSGEIIPAEYSGDSHSEEVVGKYRSARTIEFTFGKIMYPLMNSDYEISTNQNGGINLKVSAYGIDSSYVEVAPYHFVRVDGKNTLMDKAGMNMSKLYFLRDSENKVTALTFGSVDQSLKISEVQSTGFTIGYIAICILVLLVGLISAVIMKIRNRKDKNKDNKLVKYYFSLSILGLLEFGNVVVQTLRFLAKPELSSSAFLPHIILSYIILILQVINIFFVMRNLKAARDLKVQKMYLIVLSVATVMMIVFLYSYNFYKFI